MFELFVVGTFWFWALVVAEIVLLFTCVNYDNGFWATLSLLVFGACLQWFGQVDILGFIAAHPWRMAGAVAAYFILGVLWCIVRWYVYCLDCLRRYEEEKAIFLEENHLPKDTEMNDTLKKRWLDHIRYSAIGSVPKVKENKHRILGWMTFWVISVIWFFINDFVKRIFREVYRFISGFLQRMADNMFAHIAEETRRDDR